MLKSGQENIGYSHLDMFLGNIPGALGETSKLLLLIGFFYLCYRQVVHFWAAITYIVTVVAITFVFGGNGWFTGDVLTNLLGGGLILGACYMITDYPSVAPRVKVMIAILAGIVTASIRIWGTLPEGVCFGILTGNCLSGLVEWMIQPHIYGVDRKKSNNNL
jgi:electron transport complex protein RnfD